MKRHGTIRMALVRLVCAGLILPGTVRAEVPQVYPTTQSADSSTSPISMVDVALGSGGNLNGRVVDDLGHGMADQPVFLWQDGQAVAQARTDAQGAFAMGSLRGGPYRVVSANGVRHCRLWAPGSAPPHAERAVVLVGDPTVVRGQSPACGRCGHCRHCCGAGAKGGGPLGRLVRNPWVIAGLIGAAVAIPLAVENDDNDPPAS